MREAVVVHAGRRDNYQVALALQEAGLLNKLVTDFYFPGEKSQVEKLFVALKMERTLSLRYVKGLPSNKVCIPIKALMLSAFMQTFKSTKYNPVKGKLLGTKAKRLALKNNSAIISYSTYASGAFKNKEITYRILFQHHPHPYSVRKIFEEETFLNPASERSLKSEYEYSLSPAELKGFINEPNLATGWITASSFTAKTLVEQGIPAGKIHIIPYGVDLKAFSPKTQYNLSGPLKILYVGSFNQRKGLSYLLDAVRILGKKDVQLTLVGRGIMDDTLLSSYSEILQDIRINISHEKLVEAFHEADVFVLPSLVEGFAQVLLEAMACGVPIVTTENTAGPDIITNGTHGFIVPIRDVDGLVYTLKKFIQNRTLVETMGKAAALQASRFTWEKFRTGIVSAYKKIIG